jgi:hypothetical protein
MSPTLLEKILSLLSGYEERCPKPFIMILQPGHLEGELVKIRSKFVERGITTFAGFQQGANALSKVIGYHRFRACLD